jgi:hypothetical protein
MEINSLCAKRPNDPIRSSQNDFSAPPDAAGGPSAAPPAAAAAGPTPPETPSSRSNSNPFSGFFSSRLSKSGRIRVAIPGNPNIGYISATVSAGQKHITLTQIPGEALQVRVPGSRGIVRLKMMVRGPLPEVTYRYETPEQNSVWPYLGLTWSNPNPSHAQDSTE